MKVTWYFKTDYCMVDWYIIRAKLSKSESFCLINHLDPFLTTVFNLISTFSLVFSFQQDRDDTEAADAAGEESEENVGGGDQPEGEDINHWVAVMLCPY